MQVTALDAVATEEEVLKKKKFLPTPNPWIKNI